MLRCALPSKRQGDAMAEPASGKSKAIQKIVFSSDELPAELDDRARFSLWRDLYTAYYGSLDLSRPVDRPFSVRLEFAQFGRLGLGRFNGTVNRATRTLRAVADDDTDDFRLVVNRGRFAMSACQRDREAALVPQAAVLVSETEAGEFLGEAHNAWFSLVVPRRPLLQLVAHAEDIVATAVDPDQPVLRHLARYLDILLAPAGVGDDPALIAHIDTTLLDLIALVLGAEGDAAQIARMRGVRAARVQEALAEIRAGFADPAFSPHELARKTKLSARYLQDLLQETGSNFTERVMELRLQKARAMLQNLRHDRLKVSEIAYACGFNEVSHFNRSFRARFGTSPTAFRGSDGGKG
jgi:AraC-like DNA-binding protein